MIMLKTPGKPTYEEAEKLVQETVASNRLEGLDPTQEEIDMLRKYAHGEITKAEYKAWILEHAGVSEC